MTPEEISPTNAGTPSWHAPNNWAMDGACSRNRTVFFFPKKCALQIRMLMIGDAAVASAAPSNPMPSGNIKI